MNSERLDALGRQLKFARNSHEPGEGHNRQAVVQYTTP